eukprot:4442673-Amphidinium_carterae.1
MILEELGVVAVEEAAEDSLRLSMLRGFYERSNRVPWHHAVLYLGAVKTANHTLFRIRITNQFA